MPDPGGYKPSDYRNESGLKGWQMILIGIGFMPFLVFVGKILDWIF